MSIPTFNPSKFDMCLLGIFHRIVKSVTFNILMIILGFCVGFFSLAIEMHYRAITNPNYVYIAKLEQKMREMEKMDDDYDMNQHEIRNLLNDLKMGIAYEGSHFERIVFEKANKKVNKTKKED